VTTIHRSGQDWILDRLIRSGGIDTLMPDFFMFMQSPVMGFNVADGAKLAAYTRGMSSMRRAYEKVAARREAIASAAEADGHTETARRHYHLAALAYAVAQYMIQEDGNVEKMRLQAKAKASYGKVAEFSGGLVERVEIPFEDEPAFDGDSFPGLLHLPPGSDRVPTVIFLPGTDMTKENVPNPEDNLFAKRGLACLSIDGPGQGESLTRGLKVHVGTWNYERAVSAAIDYLTAHPRIDPDRIAVFGCSTGSYWAPRAAIWEARHGNRIRAVAGLAAQWEPSFTTEFEYAQPNFKTNYMYMAGVEQESQFDAEAPLNTLDGLLSEVTAPVLIAQGEYDELCTPEVVEGLMQQLKTPHLLRVYEGEFHPLGMVALEAYEGCADWLRDRLNGDGGPTSVERIPEFKL
jgi:dienelactone hydrolase